LEFSEKVRTALLNPAINGAFQGYFNTYLFTVPGHLAINTEPTTNDSPEAILPMINGRRRPVWSTHRTQHASPINAIILLIDWNSKIRLEVKPIVVKI